jgi:hypothetical protein
VGPDKDSYRPLVEERFSAARGVMSGSSDPKSEDLFMTHTYNPAGQSLAMLKAVVDDARSRGDWLVFMFHGVGGDYITTDGDTHAALLDYLKASQDVWVAPFGQAAEAVRKSRGE